MTLGIFSNVLAAVAYAAFAAGMLYGRRRGAAFADDLLIFASLASAVWAASAAYFFHVGMPGLAAFQLAEVARDGAWLVYAGRALWRRGADGERTQIYPVIILAALCSAAALFALSVMPGADTAGGNLPVDFFAAGHWLMAVAGLVLVENLFRNSVADSRWHVKFLCLSVGAIFGFDFILYSHALVFQELNRDMLAARGAANTMVIPLLTIAAMRTAQVRSRLVVSRRMVFHSAALTLAIAYVAAMATMAYGLRQQGWESGRVLEAIFLFAAALLGGAALVSGRARAWMRTVVEKNFLRYRYDYRDEWLRFINTLSAGPADARLPVRVVQAIADIVDSPEGAVWWLRKDESFALAATWNTSRWRLDAESSEVRGDSPLMAFLARRGWVINIDEHGRHPDRYDGIALPAWIGTIGRAWIMVPLFHRERLYGFLVLGRPRATRDLVWEDYDLLKIVGRQAASYLTEHELSHALAEARQFEELNRRIAFVAHDLKNLVSQLSLIVANAPRHGADATFQADVIRTVGDSVSKMKRLLTQLSRASKAHPAARRIPLGPLVERVVERLRLGGSEVAVDLGGEELAVVADEDRISAVVAHLLDNAIEAAGGEGHVRIRLFSRDGQAVIDVEDDGRGMDADFIRDRLFRPFESTKSAGFGIGAYECREFATAMGGRLDVVSAPGQGTTMRLSLPAAAMAAG
jgi:putative PEP-CTERM system histidine kinase